jgi:ribonuclease III
MDLSSLENLLGYEFSDRDLLTRALTHRSWAHENLAGEPDEAVRGAQNEALEFVGDSVVGLAIAETLFRRGGRAGDSRNAFSASSDLERG